ncbi:MAG: CHASE2 domain-containing protein [Candidatus Thiodiazotropha sp. (ex Monitilora ramsayi)]|nr:CHASE2 domain-containing protein [Candidatus Thiodiazotropha sp. (ex Monitilora ramsayi)]
MSRGSQGLPERFRSALILMLFTCLIAASGWLWRWDQVLYDLQLGFMSTDPSEDIVIVAVDEKSLEALGRWPWSRSVHARLVEKLSLAGARAIVLDVLFAEPDRTDPEGDIQLIHAIAASDRVFMPVILEQQRLGGMLVESMPLPAMSNVAAGLGHVHMDLDADGIGRGIYLYEGLGQAYWPHLMLAVQQWLESDKAQTEPVPVMTQAPNVHIISRRSHRLIPFTGPAGNYPRYSYSEVLEGAYMQDLFRDRIVLVGVTATGLGDALPTPVSGHGVPMPGVEINANVFDSLRRGTSIEQVGFIPHMIGSGLIVMIPFLLYAYFPTRFAPLVSLTALIGFVLFNWILLQGAHVWFPPSSAVLGLVLSYPFWSWRRLDQAVRYLNDQLERMQYEQKHLSAQQPEGDLVGAIRFLSHLMPLSGWALHDANGRLLMHGGESLNEPIDGLVQGEWRRSGAELWTRIPRQENEWQVGMLWPRTQVPQGRSLNLLDDFAQQFVVDPEEDHDSVLERVELRMQKMQQVNVKLQRFRHLISSAVGQMDDGLMVINSLGQVVMSNPRAAFYLGREKEADLLGEEADKLLQVLEIRDAWQWPEVFQHVLLKGEPIRFEAFRAPDTELFVQLKPLDESGAGMHGVVVNISYIGTLKRSERTRVKMLNFLSHDIRSPITSLLSLTQSRKMHERTATELAEQIQPLARRSLKLADNFLQLARAEAVDTTRFEDTDFISVAHNAIDEAYVQAKAAGITLRRQFEEDEIWLQGDLGLLERALFNLLENAIKFSPSGSEVVMDVRREDGFVVCSIRDQGPGIPQDQLTNVFLPFTYAETENTSQGNGVGLGLSFVKVVADKHRGTIEAANGGDGGAVFILRIPCESESPV